MIPKTLKVYGVQMFSSLRRCWCWIPLNRSSQSPSRTFCSDSKQNVSDTPQIYAEHPQSLNIRYIQIRCRGIKLLITAKMKETMAYLFGSSCRTNLALDSWPKHWRQYLTWTLTALTWWYGRSLTSQCSMTCLLICSGSSFGLGREALTMRTTSSQFHAQ